jgi:REP element-mobilizing transposase RayT
MLPRQVLPRRFYLITRRCTQRQLLLRPDPATNNAFLYCLIAAATRCQIDLLLACALSNHYHLVIYDRAGRYPEFIEHFHKLVARSQNALRGRWENFWASEQTCVVNLVDRNAVIDKLVYTATNPVLAHLVERVHHWPGVNSLTALLAGRQLRGTRPLHFFRADGLMPDDLEMPLSKQVDADRGPAAQSYVCHGVRRRPRTLARGTSRRISARHLLAPAVCLGAGPRDLISSSLLTTTNRSRGHRCRHRSRRTCPITPRISPSLTMCSSIVIAGHSCATPGKTTHRSNVGSGGRHLRSRTR